MHTNFRTILFTLVAVLGVTLYAGASRPTPADPNWKHHSSFDNLPRRIVDTPDAVYFFVHQRPYLAGSQHRGYYSVPTGAVFIREKAHPDAFMTDLHQVANLSGTDVRTFSVNPATGAIVMTYCDGGIDFIAPNRKVTFHDNIQRRNYPGASTVNNVSFDKSRNIFWVSTNSGYIAISAADGSIVRETSWTSPVADVNSVGDLLVAIIDSKICTAPYGDAIARQKSFTPIEGLSYTGNPIEILPLSPRHFGLITSTGVLYYLTLTDGTWSIQQKMDHASMILGAGACIANQCESTVTPTRNGYMISHGTYAYLLGEPETENGAPTFTKVTLPSGSTRYAASYNLSDYWFYRERGMFHTATLTGTTWSALSEPFRPNAPLSTYTQEFNYHPKHGFVANNTEYAFRMTSGYIEPALITIYRNGVWKNVSGAYNRPYYADQNSGFATVWQSNLNKYPVADPRGLYIDPVFPDVVHMGSAENGAVMFNIADPRRYPIYTRANNHAPFQNYPGINEFRSTTVVCAAGADSNNNIWLAKSNSWMDGTVDFFYMTPEERRPLLEAESDPMTLIPNTHWHKITAQLPYNIYWGFKAYHLQHPKNNSKIIMTMQADSRIIAVYDHKNTLEDTSDDTLDVINYFALPSGSKDGTSLASQIIEDPNSGDIYILSIANSYVIDLDDPIVDETITARSLTVKSPEGLDSEIIMPLKTQAGCFDEYGRLWVATLFAGVIGIDPATETLVAHYTTGNSPLPSDNVHGVGWNPETKSLFITTNLGTVEVKVDAPQTGANHLQTPFLMPAEVSTAYTGTISVRNVPEAMSACVVDADGNRIALLPLPVSGVTHWDLRDAEGNRVPAGLYRIVDPSASTDFRPLTLLIAD